MNEEILPEESVDVGSVVDYRSISAWILMVMFIVVTPIGAALATNSIGLGLVVFGLTSITSSWIIGNS